MPLARFLFDEFAPDRPPIGMQGLDRVENLLPMHGNWREIYEPEALTDQSDTFVKCGVATGVIQPDGATFGGRLYIGTSGISDAFLIESDLTEVAAIRDASKAGGYSSAGDGKTEWSFAQFGRDRIVATNYLDPVQTLTSAGGSFADLFTSTTKPLARYVGVVRTHLFMSGMKVGATEYPNRVWWTAKDNAADAEPGSDKAGWAEIPAGRGEITGQACFEEFALVWTQNAVYRFTYVGGATVFERREIAGGVFGMSPGNNCSVAKVGADVYYRARSAFAAIRGGEVAELIGQGLIDSIALVDFMSRTQSDYPVGAAVCPAAVDGSLGHIWWRFLATTPDDFHQTVLAHFLIYNPVEGRWSALLDAAEFGDHESVATAVYPAGTFYGDQGINGDVATTRNVGFVRLTGTGTLSVEAFRTGGGPYATRLRSLWFGAPSGLPSVIRRLRLMYLNSRTDPTDAVITLEGTRALGVDPHVTLTFNYAHHDGNYWLSGQGLPATASWWRVDVEMPPAGNSPIHQIIGVDLDVDVDWAVQ